MLALLNFIGLILNIYGVWLIYKSTPKVDTMSYLMADITINKDARANKLIKLE